jgi:DNA-3-methyladenine glycosylase II
VEGGRRGRDLMAKPSATPTWTRDDRYLMNADKVLRRVIEEQGPIHPEIDRRGSRPDPWEALARAIVGQQLSTRAAASIWEKLTGLFGGRAPTPEELLRKRPTTLLKAGLSNAKVAYLRDLARRVKDGRVDLKRLRDLSDEDVCAELVEVKGIGRWTAEMFLIFHLMRPNVLPLDDIGLINGISRYYFSGDPVSRSDAREVAAAWAPFCSVATWYIWRSLDPLPVEY